MGIVKISDVMHENLRVASNALSRSINAQAEHWMRVGMLTEVHLELNHWEISQLLIRAEMAGGWTLPWPSLASSTSPVLLPPENTDGAQRRFRQIGC